MTSPTAVTTISELADRYGEAWNSQDVDAIADLHTEDSVFQLHIPGGAPVEGRDAIRAAFAAFVEQLPDINFATRRLYAGEDHWVLESTLTGTVAAPMELDGEQLDARGSKIEVDCVDVIAVRDGKVARKETYLDAVAFQRQMGLS
jgi:steroid delta-isomerase-like uncharacterized protein